jgi:phosphinothricin acetyltransferase
MIRDASPGDGPAVAEIYAAIVRETAISFEEEVPSVEELITRMQRSYLWLVAQERAKVVGYAYASRFHSRSAYRWSSEISVYLSGSSRDQGIGGRLLATL